MWDDQPEEGLTRRLPRAQTPFSRKREVMLETDGGTPWDDIRVWREANLAISHAVMARREELARARGLAVRMEPLLEFVVQVMEELGQQSCAACQDPCCRSAEAGFDLRDLVFLHLTGQAVPLTQPLSGGAPVCRHLGAAGCLLPRLSRPWVCRWYLCPRQKRLLRLNHPESAQRRFELAMRRIANLRRRLGDELARISSRQPRNDPLSLP
jgi:hypothetical protein